MSSGIKSFGAMCLLALLGRAGAYDIPALTREHRNVFCAVDGHETSVGYSRAVVADLKRREAAGRSTKDALRDMRAEYCGGSGK